MRPALALGHQRELDEPSTGESAIVRPVRRWAGKERGLIADTLRHSTAPSTVPTITTRLYESLWAMAVSESSCGRGATTSLAARLALMWRDDTYMTTSLRPQSDAPAKCAISRHRQFHVGSAKAEGTVPAMPHSTTSAPSSAERGLRRLSSSHKPSPSFRGTSKSHRRTNRMRARLPSLVRDVGVLCASRYGQVTSPAVRARERSG